MLFTWWTVADDAPCAAIFCGGEDELVGQWWCGDCRAHLLVEDAQGVEFHDGSMFFAQLLKDGKVVVGVDLHRHTLPDPTLAKLHKNGGNGNHLLLNASGEGIVAMLTAAVDVVVSLLRFHFAQVIGADQAAQDSAKKLFLIYVFLKIFKSCIATFKILSC